MRRNTHEQNRNLDVVGDAAADIKRLAYVSAGPAVYNHVWTANHCAGPTPLPKCAPCYLALYEVHIHIYSICVSVWHPGGHVQGIEAEAQRQMPVVDATVDRVGEARAGVRNTAKQTYNYRTGR